MGRPTITGLLVLGDTDAALDKIADYAQDFSGVRISRLILERSPMYDPISNEPAFIALLDDYRKNAEEQRKILQTMTDDPS